MEPPLPPLKRLPGPALDVEARQEGTAIVVTGRLPAANRDGSAIEKYRGLEISGYMEPTSGDVETPEPFALLRLSEKDLAERMTGRAFQVTVTDLVRRLELGGWPDEARLTLLVQYQNERNHRSEALRLPAVPVAVVSAPPADVSVEVEKQGVVLTWAEPAANIDDSRPARYDGVAVFRRQLPDGPIREIGQSAPGERRFMDKEAAVDQEFSYAVSPFRQVGQDRVFGGKSDWQAVDTRDVFGPESPRSVNIVLDENKIKLLWDPVPDEDLAGYHVYRRRAGEEALRRLTGQPLNFPSFTDEEADPAANYVYVVTAVDTHGNESPRSAEVAFPQK
jgi:hypothetical protein